MSTLMQYCDSLKEFYTDSDKSDSTSPYQSCNELSRANSQNSCKFNDDCSMYTNSQVVSSETGCEATSGHGEFHDISPLKLKKSKRNRRLKSEKSSVYEDALSEKYNVNKKDDERLDFLLFAEEVTEDNFDKANRFLMKLDAKNIFLTNEQKHEALREYLKDRKSAKKYFRRTENTSDQVNDSENLKESVLDSFETKNVSNGKLEDFNFASSHQSNDFKMHDIKTNSEKNYENSQSNHNYNPLKSTKASSYHDLYMNESHLKNDNPLKYMFSLKDLPHRNLRKSSETVNDFLTKSNIDFLTPSNENPEKIGDASYQDIENFEHKSTESNDHSLSEQEKLMNENSSLKSIISNSSLKQKRSRFSLTSNETITFEDNEQKSENKNSATEPIEKQQEIDSQIPIIRTQTFLIDDGACGDSLSTINSHRRLSQKKSIPKKALLENNSYNSEAFMMISDHAVSDTSSEKKFEENFYSKLSSMSEVSNVKSLYKNFNDDVCSEAFTKLSSSCKFDIAFDDELMNVEEEAEPTISITSTATRISRISVTQADIDRKREAAFDEWIKTVEDRERQKKEQMRKKKEEENEKAQLKKTLNEQKVKEWNMRKDKEALEKMAHSEELKKRSVVEKIIKRNTKKVFKKALTHEEWLALKNQEVKRKLLEIKEKQEKEARQKEEENQIKEQKNQEAYQKWIERTKNVPKPVPFGEGLSSLRGSTTEIYGNPIPWQSAIESN